MIDLSPLQFLKGKKALVAGIATINRSATAAPRRFEPSAPIWR